MDNQTKRICLITPGHLSKNPRLVKEADALVEAGYDVHVIAGNYHPWGHDADEQYEDRAWSLEYVAYGPLASTLQRVYLGGRKRAAEVLADILPIEGVGINLRAYHWAIPEFTRRARATEADLFIAHNLSALPAAARAATEHTARLGFDAEDFHRGQFQKGELETLKARLTRWLEETYLPQCDYVTAASPGIASAYSEALGIEEPTTILNVFPRDEESGHTPPEELHDEHPGTGISLYWYSQTIGPDRGLEMVVRAMGKIANGDADTPQLTLSLRGGWADGYEDELRSLAHSLGLEDSQIRHLRRAPPEQLIERASQHDVGLALEQAQSRNRDLCITNKIFAYLQAGIPVLATDTIGQRFVHRHAPDAVALCPLEDVRALAQKILEWGCSSEKRSHAADVARRAAESRFNWGVEKESFLSIVRSVLGGNPS